MIESCQHEIRVIQVKWTKHPSTLVKLNMDGSAIDNPGKIRASDIIRDHTYNLIYAFVTPLGIGSNNQAEMQMATLGITWCIQHVYNRVILEVDSEFLVKCIK